MEKRYFLAIMFVLSSSPSVFAATDDQSKQYEEIQEVISTKLSQEFPVFAPTVSGRKAFVNLLCAAVSLGAFLYLGIKERVFEGIKNKVADTIAVAIILSIFATGCAYFSCSPLRYIFQLYRRSAAPRTSVVDLVKKLKKSGKIPNVHQMFALDLWYRSFETILLKKKYIKLVDGNIDQKASRDFVTVVGEESVKKMDTIFKLRAQQKKKPSPALYTIMIREVMGVVDQLIKVAH